MISAIGAIGHDYDPEYLQIIRELRKYGLTPSGNKEIDKSRLAQAKLKQEQAEEFLLEDISKPDENKDTERALLEELRMGPIAIKLESIFWEIIE